MYRESGSKKGSWAARRNGCWWRIKGGVSNKKTPESLDTPRFLNWLREPDLNRRPSGYEPDELPGCSIPRSMGRAKYHSLALVQVVFKISQI